MAIFVAIGSKGDSSFSVRNSRLNSITSEIERPIGTRTKKNTKPILPNISERVRVASVRYEDNSHQSPQENLKIFSAA